MAGGIGQNVHAKFGQGVIVDAEGQGHGCGAVQIISAARGMKWLALEYAKLSAALSVHFKMRGHPSGDFLRARPVMLPLYPAAAKFNFCSGLPS